MQFVLIYLDYLHIKNYTKIRSFQTYIYILHEPIILSCLPDAYTMWEQKSNVRSKLYEIRDGECRLIDRIANVFSACKETSEIKWHVEW